MSALSFTAVFPFCGLGAGARGFLDAQIKLFGTDLRFRCLGGIDLDPAACKDFDYLTGTPAQCIDVEQITAQMLRDWYGESSPDCVFLSPPCKGASGLLPKELAGTEKYQAMNKLALVWMRVMLEAWRDAPPKLVLLENVPRLRTRAKEMLDAVKKLLRGAGYKLHEGFHDCGEIGGLAQRRRRYLLVARLHARCPNLLYEPPKLRVKACGEVLEKLPVPATDDAELYGAIHRLPRISWLNWVRLACIPPGGDWRDLEGVLAEGQPRRAVFKRHEVAPWDQPTGVITGSGANAVSHVQDPRVEPFGNVDRITAWDAPVGTITRSPAPSSGAPAVAEPRIEWFGGVLGVKPWDGPAPTVTSRAGVSTGAFAVADPRAPLGATSEHGRGPHAGAYGVAPWEDPAGAVCGESLPSNGRFAVADPRALALPPSEGRHWNKYAVGSWDEPARAVIGATQPGSGGPGVADPRVRYAYDAGYAVLGWEQAARTIAGTAAVGCGAYAVAEPRPERPPFNADLEQALSFASANPKRPPSFLPVILAADGTWHRPLTTLELAALQGLPTTWKGAPLALTGKSQSAWRERIGNAVPVGAARAIAEKMLVTLAASALGTFSMDGGAVWVLPNGIERDGMMLEELHA